MATTFTIDGTVVLILGTPGDLAALTAGIKQRQAMLEQLAESLTGMLEYNDQLEAWLHGLTPHRRAAAEENLSGEDGRQLELPTG